ncbi:MAG TPA: hypothetical protein VMQ73_04825 [Methylomirabilota bacterium]|nr:hypothetical protein [Methylomirabilota bacterium]
MNRLTVALFATNDANYAACLNDYVSGANTMLQKYGMALELFPTNPANPAAPRILPYTGAVFDSAEDPGTVRAQCHQAVPNGRGIPVIFCKRNTDDATSAQIELGSTIQTKNPANGGVQWLPYVIINTQGKSPANEVLLHELIHAAYGENQPNKPGDPHDRDPGSCFYGYGTSATNPGALSGKPTRTLPANHADVLRKAYFSIYAP